MTAPRRGFRIWLTEHLDAERPRWFLWLPVLFGLGSLIYFSMRREPTLVEFTATAMLALLLLSFPRQSTLLRVGAGILLTVVCGFVAAKVRTEWVRAPVVSEWAGLSIVSGTVHHVEVRETGAQRFVLTGLTIDGLVPERTPARVRIQTRKLHVGLMPGMRVRVKARLSPPPGPVVPGGFDFSRWAYFQQLGGLGFATKPIEILPTRQSQSRGQPHLDGSDGTSAAATDLTVQIAQLRQRINQRVRTVLPGQTGAIATALITGERAGIAKETNTVYRNSGLFHILSISGLHMAIMGGAIFVGMRFLLAAVPALALRFAIKKWAAILAILGALGYLTISGMTFATLRSFVMIVVMFMAILLDRPALALRNVAVAALLLLVLFPESILDAGFQMSFAAVIALIAGYESFSAWRHRRQMREMGHDGQPGMIAKTGVFFGGVVMSTLLAGGAVAPIAAYHFHTSQQLAVLANLIAVPLTNVIVMPAALATLVLMPFGLDAVPLHIMGFGVDAMTDVAQWVAGLPGAVAPIPVFSTIAFALMIVGGLWLALMGTGWRVLGLALAAAGVLLVPGQPRPDVLVGRDGRTIAVRDASGRLFAVMHARSTFALQTWLRRDGDVRPPQVAIAAYLGKSRTKGTAVSDGMQDGSMARTAEKRTAGPFRCDAAGCVAHVKGVSIALIRDVSSLREACQSGSIIIARWTLPKRCRVVIEKRTPTARRKISTADRQTANKARSTQKFGATQKFGGRSMQSGTSSAPIVIDRRALRRDGAHAVFINSRTDAGWFSSSIGRLWSDRQSATIQQSVSMHVDTVGAIRGNRPWTQTSNRWKTVPIP